MLGIALVFVATYYSPSYTGRIMANGKRYDPQAMTAASNVIPLNTKVIVCQRYPKTGAPCIRVTITDRLDKRFNDRLDLSEGAYTKLGLKEIPSRLPGGLSRVIVYRDMEVKESHADDVSFVGARGATGPLGPTLPRTPCEPIGSVVVELDQAFSCQDQKTGVKLPHDPQ